MRKFKMMISALCVAAVSAAMIPAVLVEPSEAPENSVVYAADVTDEYSAFKDFWYSYESKLEQNGFSPELAAEEADRIKLQYFNFGKIIDEEANADWEAFKAQNGYEFPKISQKLAEKTTDSTGEIDVVISVFSDRDYLFLESYYAELIGEGVAEDEAAEICRYYKIAKAHMADKLSGSFTIEVIEEAGDAIDSYTIFDDDSFYKYLNERKTALYKEQKENRINEIIELCGMDPEKIIPNQAYEEDYDYFKIWATPEQINKAAELDIVREIGEVYKSEPGEQILPTESPAVSFTQNYICGDANCDGKVTIADSTAILQYLGNADKYPLSDTGAVCADCYNTGDGITGLDAIAIQMVDTKLITSLPLIEKVPERPVEMTTCSNP